MLRTNTQVDARRGYVALLSVLIVSAIASTTILILFMTSVNSALNSRDIDEGRNAKVLADSCAEVALQWLTNGSDDPCPSPCNVAGGTDAGQCTIVSITDSGDGKNWTIHTTGSGTQNKVTRYVEVQAYRPAAGSASTIMSWKEVPSF